MSDVANLLQAARNLRDYRLTVHTPAGHAAAASLRANLAAAADELEANANAMAGQCTRWKVRGRILAQETEIFLNAPDAASAWLRAHREHDMRHLTRIEPDVRIT